MKKTMFKLCLEFLVIAILLPIVFALPVMAEDPNAKPAVYLSQYEDDFTAETPDERIALYNGVYENGMLTSDNAEYNRYRMYLNRNQGAAVGNIVTEFTVKQSGLMSSADGQIQMFLFSSSIKRLIDICWRDLGSTQDVIISGRGVNHRVDFSADKSELKVTIQYNTSKRTTSIWIDDVKVVSDSADFVYQPDGDACFMLFNGTSSMNVMLEDFKWYYAKNSDVPVIQESLFHVDFEEDDASPASTSQMILDSSDVTYSVAKGALKLETSKTGGVMDAAVFNLTEDGSGLTGEYVIEAVLHNPTGKENYHRFVLGDYFFIEWNTDLNKALISADHFIPGRNTISFPYTAEEFGTQGNTLKVTAKYNTEERTVALWINDMLAWEHVYDPADAERGTALKTAKIAMYQGNLEVADFHCYRPVPKVMTGDEKIAEAYEGLTEADVFPAPLTENGYLADDLNLPTVGKRNVDITWSVNAEAEGVVDVTTGFVTRSESETNVTLTATFSADGGTDRTKTYSFKVPARGVSVDGLPKMLNMAYRENYEAKNEKTMLFDPGAVGVVEIKDEKLSISTTGTSASAVCAYQYLNEQRTAISGEFGIEFIMERPSGSDGLQLILGNDQTPYLCDLRWDEEAVQYVTGWNGTGFNGSMYFDFEDFDIGNRFKVTILHNTETGLSTLLFNNKVAIENHQVRPGPVSFLRMIRDNRVFTTTVDNFRFYYLKTDDNSAARLDAGELSYDTIFKPSEVAENVIAYDVTLPTKGMRDSGIIWTSSHPEILSTDGVITRPEADTEVTMTASVTSGDVTVPVVFKVTVLRGGDGDLVILKKDYDLLTLESILTGDLVGEDLISDDLNLYTDCEFGSTITWETNNASIITADGRVTRPENQEGNIYATLTATVTNGDYSLTKTFRLGAMPLDTALAISLCPNDLKIFLKRFTPFTQKASPITQKQLPLLTTM